MIYIKSVNILIFEEAATIQDLFNISDDAFVGQKKSLTNTNDMNTVIYSKVIIQMSKRRKI